MLMKLFNKLGDYMIGYTPTEEERAVCERIHTAFQVLGETRKLLMGRFTMPEVSTAWNKGQREEDLSTWDFNAVFMEKLKDRGWPAAYISYEAGLKDYPETASMNTLLFLMRGQSSIKDIYLILKQQKKSDDLYKRRAVRIVTDDVATLESVVNELKDFKEADLQPRHMMILVGTKRTKRPPSPQS